MREVAIGHSRPACCEVVLRTVKVLHMQKVAVHMLSCLLHTQLDLFTLPRCAFPLMVQFSQHSCCTSVMSPCALTMHQVGCGLVTQAAQGP